MEKLICEFCGGERKTKMSLSQHKVFCKENPNRKKTYSEEWTEDKKKKHSEIMKIKNSNKDRVWNVETIEKLKTASKKFNETFWTDEKKLEHSIKMREVVKSNPDSYSTSNVCGRTKIINYNGFKLNGSWELEVAKWLDDNNIKWTNIMEEPFEYFWNGRPHSYFPDFYLEEKDIYIEVKGFKRERDEYKWKSVPNLLVISKNDIVKIKEKKYSL